MQYHFFRLLDLKPYVCRSEDETAVKIKKKCIQREANRYNTVQASRGVNAGKIDNELILEG